MRKQDLRKAGTPGGKSASGRARWHRVKGWEKEGKRERMRGREGEREGEGGKER